MACSNVLSSSDSNTNLSSSNSSVNSVNSTNANSSTDTADTNSSNNPDYVWNLDANNIALRGYDSVAYFSLSSPTDNAVKGSKDFSYKWQGATWHFSSNKNLEAFKSNPEKYAPKYGGYCAYAAARNYLYQIDPNAWTVKNGSLYLNANKSTRKSWLKNIDSEILKAEKNWPSLRLTATR